LQGIEGFADIMKTNGQTIMDCLSERDRERLYRFMPEGMKDKE
jgi:hypothetical protein